MPKWLSALLAGIVLLVLVGIPLYRYHTHRKAAVPPAGKTDHITLVIRNRRLVSGPNPITVHSGDQVILQVTADENEELHLHGYDKMVDLTKDKPATLTFTANLTGHFPYELEHSKTEIGAVEVQPYY